MFEVVVGTVGGLIAALIGALVALRTHKPSLAKLELVDVTLTRDLEIDSSKTGGELAVSVRSDLTNTIDVKLRNPGAQPIFVKRAHLEIVDIQRLPNLSPPHWANQRDPITATAIVSEVYGIQLPVPSANGKLVVSHDISQVVPPTDIDRFQIRLDLAPFDNWNSDESPFVNEIILYRILLRLLYNTDEDVVSRPLILCFPEIPCFLDSQQIRSKLQEFQDKVVWYRRLGWLAKFNHAPSPRVFSPEFWRPEEAVQRYFDSEETRLRGLIAMLALDGIRDPALDRAAQQAQSALRDLPALRHEFTEEP